MRSRPAFPIYRWNWATFQVWAATWRQWRWIAGGMGKPVRDGIDWQQVQSALTLSGVPPSDWPGILNGLRVMQGAALDALAAQE